VDRASFASRTIVTVIALRPPIQHQAKVVGLGLRPNPTYGLFATIIVTVVPPTGTVEIYTPGFDDTPAVFKGTKSAGEFRLNGPIVYVHLKYGATAYEVEYLSWREP
jgi:hypothetical protein